MGNSYVVLAGMPEGKRPIRRSRRRWEDNIKMDIIVREIIMVGVDWIHLEQDTDRWRSLVSVE
jgi:hypothetical protein